MKLQPVLQKKKPSTLNEKSLYEGLAESTEFIQT